MVTIRGLRFSKLNGIKNEINYMKQNKFLLVENYSKMYYFLHMRSKFAKSAILTKKIITKGSKQIYRQKHWKEVQNPKSDFFTKKFVGISILFANFEKYDQKLLKVNLLIC
jgi:hypothetical protein